MLTVVAAPAAVNTAEETEKDEEAKDADADVDWREVGKVRSDFNHRPVFQVRVMDWFHVEIASVHTSHWSVVIWNAGRWEPIEYRTF